MEYSPVRICPNCGGKVDFHDAKCPYCGFINEPGAQEAYMRNMEDMRKNLDNVDEQIADEYRDSVKKTFKPVAITLIVLVIVVAAVVGIVVFVSVKSKEAQQRQAQDKLEDVMWQKSYFAMIDEAYDAGDWEGAAQILFDKEMTSGHDVYSYDHFEFLDVVYDWKAIKDEFIPLLDAGEMNKYDYGYVYTLFKFYFKGYETDYHASPYTEEEYEYIVSLREEAKSIIHDRLHFSDAEMQKFYDESTNKYSQYPSYNDCKKITKEYIEQFE